MSTWFCKFQGTVSVRVYSLHPGQSNNQCASGSESGLHTSHEPPISGYHRDGGRGGEHRGSETGGFCWLQVSSQSPTWPTCELIAVVLAILTIWNVKRIQFLERVVPAVVPSMVSKLIIGLTQTLQKIKAGECTMSSLLETQTSALPIKQVFFLEPRDYTSWHHPKKRHHVDRQPSSQIDDVIRNG